MASSRSAQPTALTAAQRAGASTATGLAAPDIESAHWINVKNNGFGSLTGKIVVVNFWTYACHHSQSLLRHLSVLQRTYRRHPVQIIGVHTPEFLFEADVDNVKRAVRDFRINWPVAVDNDYENFNRFGVRFWPTTVLIDADGRVAGRFVGAGSFPDLARSIHVILPR
ncbi:MAG: thioredoxin-like domain-containing protein [Candidatus Andersenbacteria bacterium]